jgi:AraC-like DNA-binding protein
LRELVRGRAIREGRTESLYPALRFYRFSHSTNYHKKQLLMPGIVVVLQGSKTAQLTGQSITYDANYFLVLGIEAVCHGTVVNASEALPYLAIHLDLPSDLIVKTLATLAEYPSPVNHPQRADQAQAAVAANHSFAAPLDIDIISALTRLIAATETPLDCATLAPLVMEEIIVRLLRARPTSGIRNLASISRTALRIQESTAYITANLQRQLTISELANQLSMSPSHYAHSFREVTGVTPMRYLREQRLNKARSLLLNNKLRTAEVAQLVGFDSPEHFSRLFKRRYAESPSDYIASLGRSLTSQF